MPSELLVSRVAGQTYAAIREDGATVALRVEDDECSPSVGCVVKGRVENVLPGIQSAFVDIGGERNGFLHSADLFVPGDEPVRGSPAELGEDDPDGRGDTEGNGRSAAAARRELPPIQDRVQAGSELLVQISRGAIQSKGARLTCHVTLAGRYLVLLPRAADRGISRRIGDPDERERLSRMLGVLPDGGFIVRTAGEGASEAAFQADAENLIATWRRIEAAARDATAPALVHRDLDLTLRLLRDSPRRGFDRVVVDCPQLRDRAVEFLRPIDPRLASAIRLHEGPPGLREAYGLEQEIERALRPKVWLRSGGYIVIEQTEALVSIDVNTGRFVGRRDLGETVLRTNLEAADEIARQLRLRDLGGILVIDFIDMTRTEDRRAVIERLELALRRDSARTKIIGLSELGLLQLTRKRTRSGVAERLTRSCPTCGGRGRVKGPPAVAAEAVSEVRKLWSVYGGDSIVVRVNPQAATATRLALAREETIRPEAAGPRRVEVEEDQSLPTDRFEVVAR